MFRFYHSSIFTLKDPSYPVYVDTSVMMGMTGEYNNTGFDNIVYMECKPDNMFFPDLSKVCLPLGSAEPSHFCSALYCLALSVDLPS